MTEYSKSSVRMRRYKRRKCRPALTPYEAERLSNRTRWHWPRTRQITRKHPHEWGHFGKEVRE